MPTPLEWLATAPWPSVPELARFMYVDRSTISRQMPDWREYSLVGLRNVGFLVRPRDRLLIATAGLDRLYPDHHTHPSPEDLHDHDPLHPEWEDHGHPGYFNSEEGALSLYQKLPLAEVWYPLAPRVLQGEGAAWTHDGRPRRILSWRWLRNTAFVRAVATYEDDYKLFFVSIGRSLTVRMLQARYDHRFEDFQRSAVTSRGIVDERSRNKFIDPPDPDLDLNPQPSGHVIWGPDYRAIELALEVLPSGNAYLFVTGPPGGQCIYTGKARPAPHDDVADKFEDVDVGVPQDLCRNEEVQ